MFNVNFAQILIYFEQSLNSIICSGSMGLISAYKAPLLRYGKFSNNFIYKL